MAVTLPDRPPRLSGDPALGVVAAQFDLLNVRMQLDLVDRRRHPGFVDDPFDTPIERRSGSSRSSVGPREDSTNPSPARTGNGAWSSV